jgi:hypothetical protein
MDWFGWERNAKMIIFSVRSKGRSLCWPNFWMLSPHNLNVYPKTKMCPKKQYTTSILAYFWVFERILGNVAKVKGQGMATKGFDYFD